MFTIERLLNLPSSRRREASTPDSVYDASEEREHCTEEKRLAGPVPERKRSYDSVCDADSCNESDKDSMASGEFNTNTAVKFFCSRTCNLLTCNPIRLQVLLTHKKNVLLRGIALIWCWRFFCYIILQILRRLPNLLIAAVEGRVVPISRPRGIAPRSQRISWTSWRWSSDRHTTLMCWWEKTWQQG